MLLQIVVSDPFSVDSIRFISRARGFAETTTNSMIGDLCTSGRTILQIG